jgi:hypothetical protein
MLMSKIYAGSYRGAWGTKEKDTKEEEWKEQEIVGWCKGIMKLRGSTLVGAGGTDLRQIAPNTTRATGTLKVGKKIESEGGSIQARELWEPPRC